MEFRCESCGHIGEPARVEAQGLTVMLSCAFCKHATALQIDHGALQSAAQTEHSKESTDRSAQTEHSKESTDRSTQPENLDHPAPAGDLHPSDDQHDDLGDANQQAGQGDRQTEKQAGKGGPSEGDGQTEKQAGKGGPSEGVAETDRASEVDLQTAGRPDEPSEEQNSSPGEEQNSSASETQDSSTSKEQGKTISAAQGSTMSAARIEAITAQRREARQQREEELIARLFPEPGEGLRCRKCAALIEANDSHCARCGLDLDAATSWAPGEAPFEKAPVGREEEFEQAMALWQLASAELEEDALIAFVDFLLERDLAELGIRMLRFHLVEHSEDELARAQLERIGRSYQQTTLVATSSIQRSQDSYDRQTRAVRAFATGMTTIFLALILIVMIGKFAGC